MVFENTSQGISLIHKNIFVDKMLIICYYISDRLWKTFKYSSIFRDHRLLMMWIKLLTIIFKSTKTLKLSTKTHVFIHNMLISLSYPPLFVDNYLFYSQGV